MSINSQLSCSLIICFSKIYIFRLLRKNRPSYTKYRLSCIKKYLIKLKLAFVMKSEFYNYILELL